MIDIYLLIMDIVVAAFIGYSDFFNLINENYAKASAGGAITAFVLFSIKAVSNYRTVTQDFWETQFLTLFLGALFGAISSMIAVKVRG